MELHHLLFEHIMPFWEVAINDPMERFPKTLGLIDEMSKITSSDGEDEDKWEKKANLMKDQINAGIKAGYKEIETDKDLPMRLHTAFRGASARGNYLSVDRIDAQFACKEVCRHMAAPTELSWKALKRVGRYFSGKPRLVYTYPKQKVDHVDIYVDTDWAGCLTHAEVPKEI